MSGKGKGKAKKSTIKIPIEAPKNFKITGAYNRTKLNLTLSWEYPTSATSKKSANKWEGVAIYLSVDTNLTANKTATSTLTLGTVTTGKGKKKVTSKKTAQVGTIASNMVSEKVLLNGMLYKGCTKKSYTYSVDLTKYNPTTTVKLDAIICKLQGYNQYSKTLNTTTKKTEVRFNNKVPWALYQITLSLPETPVIESNYIAESRTINFKCTATQPGSSKHWAQTDYSLIATRYVLNSTTKKNEYTSGNRLKDVASSTALEFSKSFALSQADLINMNTKIVVQFSAKARGVRGDSATASDSWTFAYPHQMEIPETNGVVINGNLVVINFSSENSKVNNANRYTSTVWLERLPDFMIPERLLLTADDSVWLDQAARATGWERVGGEFDPSVGKFVRSADLDKAGATSPYSRTFYRIGAKNESFSSDEYYVYSEPVVYPVYATIPKPSNDTIDFLECVPEQNGTSVRVVLGYRVDYDADQNPTSDGCQISWSDDYNSWRSNQDPSSFDMPDLDTLGNEYFRVKKPESVTPVSDEMYNYWLIPSSWTAEQKAAKYQELTGSGSGQKSFAYISKAYIMGLTEGVKYYFRARRYLEETSDLPRLYGPYADYSSNLSYESASSATKLIEPTTIPKNVKLKVTSPIPIGKDLELVWTFEGDGTQTEWELKRYSASEVVEAESKPGDTAKQWKLLETATGVSVKSSKDAAGYTLLPYATVYNDDGSVKELGLVEYIENGLIYFVVGAKTTGDFGYSAPIQVQFVEPPSASLGVPSILTAQPMLLSIGSNLASCSASVKISALDTISRQGPEGLRSQASGHIVYSNKFEASDLHWTSYSGPPAPTEQVVGNSSNTSDWSETVPAYDKRYPDYYRCYEYTVSGSRYWTAPEKDIPLSQIQALGSAATNPVLLRYAGTSAAPPTVPVPVDTGQEGYSSANPASMGWCEKRGTENNRYYVVTTDTEVSDAHVYYEMCGASSTSTTSQTWTASVPTYDAQNPVYYYCYGYQVPGYENAPRYVWTEVAVDSGMSQMMSEGVNLQTASPLWNAKSGQGYFSNIILPRPLELIDGARYQVSLTLEDPETKLDSKLLDSEGVARPQVADFTVGYSRGASAPNGNHVVVFSDQNSTSASIQILTPARHVPGDVYDIYRVTPDAITKIGSDISPGATVKDLYAPFSSNRMSYTNQNEKAVNLRYRVVVRTPDGVEAWRDFLYSLKNSSIRFDWGGANAHLMEQSSLTIPYNLSYTDTFKKYFDARHHMSDRLPVGFWTSSIDRTSDISTEIIKYDSPNDKEALKSLAGYSGPVFVRRPDGCAYLANVELNSYSVSYNSEVIPVSFDITEIELTQEYMLPQGSYMSEEDRQAIEALSVAPAGFYETLFAKLQSQ